MDRSRSHARTGVRVVLLKFLKWKKNGAPDDYRTSLMFAVWTNVAFKQREFLAGRR